MVTSAAPGFVSSDGTLGYWSTEQPDDFDFSGTEEGFFPVSRLRQQYIDYLVAKVEEYEEAKQSRHYYHGAHTILKVPVTRKYGSRIGGHIVHGHGSPRNEIGTSVITKITLQLVGALRSRAGGGI